MKSAEIQPLLSSLKKLSITDQNVVTVLQKIRKDVMATKGGVQRLVKLGCVPCVLKLLYRYISMDEKETVKERAASEGKISTALSIVANLLVEKEAKQQVKRDGMETLVTLLTDCSSEEVQVRCCRSLANLTKDLSFRGMITQTKAVSALVKVLEIHYVEVEKTKNPEASSTKTVKKASAEEEDVDIEAKFPSKLLVEVACRVLRYIAEDSKVQQQLVEAGMVGSLAMLVKSEESELVACVIRTLSELWIKMSKRITEKMANEVSRAGSIPKLMDFIDSEDDKLSHEAYTVLLPLTGHPHSAALIGASDGVSFFFSHLNSPRRHIVHKELVSGLCQLAKEAVNRVKIREIGGLKVFLETLQDDALIEVQDRVISSLVSFLYDDLSLDVMLEEGLVNILLVHLQRCGDYTSDLTENLYKSTEALLQLPPETSGVPEQNTQVTSSIASVSKTSLELRVQQTFRETATCHTLQDASVIQTGSSNSTYILREEDALADGSELFEGQDPTILVSSTGEKNTSEDSEEEEKNDNGVGSAYRQRYSMNSPTYQPVTTWRMEDYNPGVTCKSYKPSLSPSSATTYSDDSGSSSGFPCSPLSIPSYYSPSQDSLLSSSRSSPASSPAYSYATLSPAHSLSDSQGGSPQCTSPCSPGGSSAEFFSPLSPPLGASSPIWEKSNSARTKFPIHALIFSSSEDEEFFDDETLTAEADIDTGSTASADKTAALSQAFTLPQEKNGSVRNEAETESWNQEVDVGKGPIQSVSIPQGSGNPPEAESVSEQSNLTQCDIGISSVHTQEEVVQCAQSSDHSSVSSPGLVGSSANVVKRKLSCEVNPQQSADALQSSRRFFRMQVTSKNDEGESESKIKRQKLRHGPSSHASVTQSNILILLSRLSVRDDLSKHLATSRVISCLTDHLVFASEPHDRCIRVLSRVMSSPHCLNSLLTMCAPATVVRIFMLDSDSALVSHDVSSTQGKLKDASIEELDMKSLMRMSSGKARSFSTEIKLSSSRERSASTLAESSLVHTSPSERDDPALESQKQLRREKSNQTPHTPVAQDCKPGSKKSSDELARIGARLLGDLSNQAMSAYGEGVISYTFHCLSDAHQLVSAASLLFLQTHWSRDRRQKMLFRKRVLDRVLSALQARHASSSTMKDVVVLGLVFLSRSLQILPRFQPGDTRLLLNKAVETVRSESTSSQQLPQNPEDQSSESWHERTGYVCMYSRAKKDLKIVIWRERPDEILQANRETLARNSSMFAAMLQGSYIESTQSEISIRDTCAEAVTAILHFLHGCDEQCFILQSLERNDDEATVTEHVSNAKEQLKHILNMIALADRFLLTDFVQYLCAIVSSCLLDATCAEEVLRFAVFHGLSDLVEDGLRSLLLSPCSVAEIASTLITLAESEYGSEIIQAIASVVKKGVANTP